MRDDSLYQGLIRRGVSRRDFMKFCSAMAATLALPAGAVTKIAEALEKAQKPYVVWLEFQDCCGDSESTLRASSPTIAPPTIGPVVAIPQVGGLHHRYDRRAA